MIRTSALLCLGSAVYPLGHCHVVALHPLSSTFFQWLQFISAQKCSFYRMVRKACCMVFTQIQSFVGIFGRTYPKIFTTIMATLHILWACNATGKFSSKDSSFSLTIQLWKARLSNQNFGFHRSFKFIRICILYHKMYIFSLTIQGNDWQ